MGLVEYYLYPFNNAGYRTAIQCSVNATLNGSLNGVLNGTVGKVVGTRPTIA